MVSGISKWFSRPIPQNFIIRNPFAGVVILGMFTFVFLLLYRPLGTHPGRYFSYGVTMGIYLVIAMVAALGSILLLKATPWFSSQARWTILRELIAIVLVLFCIGIAGYFAAFLLEEPASRWNWSTFLDSVSRAFLLGLIPFLFFTAMNIRYWFMPEETLQPQGERPAEGLIHISSQLKKEELSFYPSQLLYAESEGNYVNFYLLRDNKLRRVVIRNSINNIEEQLSGLPFFVRTHRAFIVNLKKVRSRKGNVLGYRLQLHGVDGEIPVSRNNTHAFNQRLKELEAANRI